MCARKHQGQQFSQSSLVRSRYRCLGNSTSWSMWLLVWACKAGSAKLISRLFVKYIINMFEEDRGIVVGCTIIDTGIKALTHLCLAKSSWYHCINTTSWYLIIIYQNCTQRNKRPGPITHSDSCNSCKFLYSNYPQRRHQIHVHTLHDEN